MKQLKSWFFSTVRGLNSRNKFINLADFGEPDQITFTDLLDTTLTKKIDAFNFQDQADFNNINARLDGDKFVNPSGLPELIILPGVPLTVTTVPATSLTPRHIYNIGVTYADNAAIAARVTDKLVNPSHLPKVEADTAPGNVITVSSVTSGGFTTYKVFSPADSGLFVLKTGDTMTGALVVDGDVIISIDNSSSTNTSIFGAAIVAQNPGGQYEFAYDGSGILTLSNNSGPQIKLNVISTVVNSAFVEAPNLKGMYLNLDAFSPLLSNIDANFSRIYAGPNSLKFRGVGQNFDTDLVFNSTTNRTLRFPDVDGILLTSADFRISTLQSANATNTINNGNFTQTWQWQLTVDNTVGLHITEPAASVAGTSFQDLVRITGAPGSTAHPFTVRTSAGIHFSVRSSGSIILGHTTNPEIFIGGKIKVINGEFSLSLSNDTTSSGILNNYDVVNKTYIRFTGAVTNISGFSGGSGFSQILYLTNASVGTIIIEHNGGGSLAVNQIITSTGANFNLLAETTTMFIYDTATTKWRQLI